MGIVDKSRHGILKINYYISIDLFDKYLIFKIIKKIFIRVDVNIRAYIYINPNKFKITSMPLIESSILS